MTSSPSTVGTGARTARTVPFVRHLARFGDAPALLGPEGTVSYRELADRVAEVAGQLGHRRRLVLLAGANRTDPLVAYLAALAACHPVLLVPSGAPDSMAAMIDAYDPEVVVSGGRIAHRRDGPGPDLHPDLALLLSTSGSTGSAKLVRLSHRNLQSNAESIATYLQLRPDDRAATSLPLHYCYGLSVVHSHLLRGAALVLTDRSVTDPEFWRTFREHRGTSFAGVPYTFDLLDRVGFDRMSLPHLRYVTQAGGRLAPDRVRRYAELGRRDGWQLFVMYGQTEATARMAYLPPERAVDEPGSIGEPIPGGSFRLAPLPDWPEPDVGELVYSGPNVMLGYAQRRSDLAGGRRVHELHTGDIARRTGTGRYEIVGRRSRFAKLYGLRIDLPQVEAGLARRGWTGCCVEAGGALLVAVEPGPDPRQVRRQVAAGCGLPVQAVRVHPVDRLPRLANGKPDHPAVRALAGAPAPEVPDRDLVRLFAEVLGRPDATADSTFAGLGGDSLSYVEISVRLERALGELPDQWHTTPIRQLRPVRPAPTAPGQPVRRRRSTLDTSVVLRAVSIGLVVGTHAGLFAIAGGAHLLLGVAGFNLARFHLTATARRRERTTRIARATGRVAVASMTWIALAWLGTGDYTLANVFLLHDLTGGDPSANQWHFWFIETLVYLQLGALALLAVPVVDRLEQRAPFGLPLALAGLGLVTRYGLVPGELATPLVVVWLFALGWAAAKATTWWQRLLVTLAVLATVPGFFDSPRRGVIVMAGMLLLIWVTRLPSWRPLHRVVAALAGASLYIYLTHWQVYPHLTGFSPLLATLASLAVGIGYAAVATRLTTWPLALIMKFHARVARRVG